MFSNLCSAALSGAMSHKNIMSFQIAVVETYRT